MKEVKIYHYIKHTRDAVTLTLDNLNDYIDHGNNLVFLELAIGVVRIPKGIVMDLVENTRELRCKNKEKTRKKK